MNRSPPHPRAPQCDTDLRAGHDTLTHHLLVALPCDSPNSMFSRSVVYVCNHDNNGAFGLIVNKPSDANLGYLFEKLELTLGRRDLRDQPLLVGGPVQSERGFVLHQRMSAPTARVRAGLAAEEAVLFDDLPAYANTLYSSGLLELTTSRDVLEALAEGAGPSRVLICLGYSGWGPGQLEKEISHNAWLPLAMPSDNVDILFAIPPEQRYAAALALLGIPEHALMQDAGHT